MRELFKGYYRPDLSEFTRLWKEGTFVVDANVLLNMYALAEPERDRFLKVLDGLSNRLWLPYQAALEYQRNRLSRIRQSRDKVVKLQAQIETAKLDIQTEIKSIQLAKRDVQIGDLDKRIAALETCHSDLAEALASAISNLPPVSLDDPIRDKISNIFAHNVGEPPADQAALDNLIADMDTRYANKVPPGFKDGDKGEKHWHKGIAYPGRAGDLILWRQLLNHVKSRGIKDFIFVTEDKKDDWWVSEGGQTIGPRPELVQEAVDATAGGTFWMYSSDQFLLFAKEYLNAEVTQGDIDRVKEVSQATVETEGWAASAVRRRRVLRHRRAARRAENAVAQWIVAQGKRPKSGYEFPDFITDSGEEHDGYEVKLVDPEMPRSTQEHLFAALRRGEAEILAGRLTRFLLIIAVNDSTVIKSSAIAVMRRVFAEWAAQFQGIEIVFGISTTEGNYEPVFRCGGS